MQLFLVKVKEEKAPKKKLADLEQKKWYTIKDNLGGERAKEGTNVIMFAMLDESGERAL